MVRGRWTGARRRTDAVRHVVCAVRGANRPGPSGHKRAPCCLVLLKLLRRGHGQSLPLNEIELQPLCDLQQQSRNSLPAPPRGMTAPARPAVDVDGLPAT